MRCKDRGREFESCVRFGKAVARVCGERGITQRDVAKAIGRSLSLVQSIICGGSRVSLDVACEMQRAFGVNAAWLLALDTVEPVSADE